MQRLFCQQSILLGIGLIWSISASALSLDDSRHLLSRTTFGGSLAEIQSLQSLSRGEAVRRLINASPAQLPAPPKWVDSPPPPRRKGMSKANRRDLIKQIRQWGIDLKGWWYQGMIVTNAPLTERMTLFWHNHFTSSLQKVRWPPLMYRQNQLLRVHALGNFRELLHAVIHDPAMLIYLDNAKSKKDKPNENLARELLELFTLGEGHYSERDIKEAARALTGYSVDRNSGEFKYRNRIHDGGMKQFLGQRGNFNGDDIVNIILQQPQTARLITEKLWKEFISEEPDPNAVEKLASIFRKSNYEIKPLLTALLNSAQFWAKQNRGNLIKSPVEFLVGTVRLLDIPIRDRRILVLAGHRLGQDILSPPNVKGWEGGNSWINAHTLLLRQQVVLRVTRGMAMRYKTTMQRNPNQAFHAEHLPEDVSLLQRVLLPIPPTTPLLPDSYQAALSRLLLDPAYQLK
jgi:uncharacterized protein (DUF1800 family)